MLNHLDLLRLFRQMRTEHWDYVWGAARKGCVDCSGAFVYAYRVLGGQSIKIHGSNYIARMECSEMLPISEAKPGMAAFKRREPGASKYSLPSRYKEGGAYYNGDLNDYYHIGLVSETGKTVLNAQSSSTGFVESAISQNWCGCAYLNQVNYQDEEEEEEMLYRARVIGGRLALREAPDLSAVRVCWMPEGSEISVLAEDGDWIQVRYSGSEGYCMSKFTERIEEEDGESAASGLLVEENAVQDEDSLPMGDEDTDMETVADLDTDLDDTSVTLADVMAAFERFQEVLKQFEEQETNG